MSRAQYIINLTLAAGLAALSVPAETYYVSLTGNDEASGISREEPFKTISHAAQLAQAGDTVLIDGGVYREAVVPGHGGTAESPIVYAPYPGEQVVISGLDKVTSVWTEYKDGIYRTDILMELGHRNQVFRNSESVRVWRDRSGNENHAVQSDPIFRLAIADEVVLFDGSDDFLETPVGHLESGGFLMVGALSPQGAGNAGIVLSWQESGSNRGTSYSFEGYLTDEVVSSFYNPNGGIFANYTDGILDAKPSVSSWHIIGGTVERNGTDSVAFMRIGGNHNSSNFPEGTLRELIVWNKAISDPDRQKLEGYLAHKWGLEGNFDAAHPYKDSPPVAFDPSELSGLAAWYDAELLADAAEEMMFKARWPNSLDVWNPVRATADSGTTPSSLVDADLPDYDWTGATIWIHQHPAWSLYGQQVSGHGSRYLNTENNIMWENHQLKAGSSYYVQGCLDALDIEGEWYYDAETETLYVHTGGDDPGSGIEVKKRMNAFVLDGLSHVELHDIRIIGATISTDVNSSHLVMNGLHVQYPYFSDHFDSWQMTSGLVLNGDGHALRNSELAWASGSGVVMNGDDIQVVNNHIHDCNFIGSYAAPLKINGQTQGGVVSHNTITMAGRSCIAFGSPMRNYLIQYNDLSHAGQLTQDLGMTYVNICEAGGTEIRYNWVHDNDAGHIPSGIYFDHGSKNLLIHHNVIWGVERGGLHINQYALGVLMFNNTVTSDDAGYLSKWGNQWPDDMYGCKLVNNVFTDILDTDGVEIEIADNSINYSGLLENKYLTEGSEPVDAGRIIPGITTDYVGSAPDRGAYEVGGAVWQAGHDFRNEPVVNTVLSDCPYVNRIVNSCFEWSSLHPWISSGENVKINVQVVNQGMVLTNTAMGGRQSVLLGSGTNRIQQTVTNLLPNSTYEFRGRLRADAGETVLIGVEGHGSSVVESAPVSNNAPNWSDTRVTFRTGSISTGAVIYAEKKTDSTGKVYIDDFSLIYQSTHTNTAGTGFNFQLY